MTKKEKKEFIELLNNSQLNTINQSDLPPRSRFVWEFGYLEGCTCKLEFETIPNKKEVEDILDWVSRCNENYELMSESKKLEDKEVYRLRLVQVLNERNHESVRLVYNPAY